MRKRLLFRLVLPLLMAFGLSLYFHTICQAGGFFINLAATFVGILITVFYVDWIIKKRENEKWLATDKRIADRLRNLINATVSGIRSALGFSADILNESILQTLDPIAIHNEMMRVAENVIAPVVNQRVNALDQRGWKSLVMQNTNAHNGVLNFLNIFQTRLSPQQITDLLDLQEALAKTLFFYQVFPDLAGVPKEELPQMNNPPEELQKGFCEGTARDIKEILTLAKKLSQSLS